MIAGNKIAEQTTSAGIQDVVHEYPELPPTMQSSIAGYPLLVNENNKAA